MSKPAIYANVILPVKWKGSVTYGVPEEMQDALYRGSWVIVTLRGRRYLGVVEEILYELKELDPAKVIPITSREDLPLVMPSEMNFWHKIADYYMCTVGEVFKCAYPHAFQKQVEKVRETPLKARRALPQPLPELSRYQKESLDGIEASIVSGRPALLKGVTGSGKTEIYMHLARRAMERGTSVLYLVPEIAVSRQLASRLEKCFGDSLQVYHSKTTALRKKRLFDLLKERRSAPSIVLGTRSAVFLPFCRLGLVIVDEEHDASYKQDDPSPRYSGRDAALMLAREKGAGVVLGSATPSLESLYNISIGRYNMVELTRKYHNTVEPRIEIVNEVMARRLHNMKGAFAQRTVNAIGSCLERGEQVLVFRSRRAYSPVVQCTSCGEVPKCPHCNVALTYHKFNNALACHYCEYSTRFDAICKKCGQKAVEPRGAGTEKLEEELQVLFPEAVVGRFDADSIASKNREETILKEFASGKTDILVGTQMISKGFDFDNLTLVVAVGADSLLAHQDFRADERAVQLLRQLCGRAGRRERQGLMLIQTMQPEHPVFKRIAGGEGLPDIAQDQLAERRLFGYPPFVRMVRITVRDQYEGRLQRYCHTLASLLASCGAHEVMGPVAPQTDRIKGQYISQIWIKMLRNGQMPQVKAAVAEAVEKAAQGFDVAPQAAIDVDPL